MGIGVEVKAYANVFLDTKENYAKQILMIALEVLVKTANAWMGKLKQFDRK